MLKLSDFDYSLPKELIAQYPLKERDSARLLVLNRLNSTIEHRTFKDIIDYLNIGDTIVLNDTKVLRARLKGARLTGGKAEVLLLNQKSKLKFSALIKPGRVKVGEKIIFNGAKTFCIISAKNEITFNAKDRESVYNLGLMPLPPYIKREPQGLDFDYYQTVYAKKEGAVASPTAGLHFTDALLKEIKAKGINIAYLTLHVGLGTFRPVVSEDVTLHKMEPEYFNIPQQTKKLIQETEKKNNKIIAVGTTSLRAIEAFAQGQKQGLTGLFIYPGYKFKLIDSLLTNFHLPKTTLYMLVCAFAGQKFIKKAYEKAINKKYRFYSYGDAMLII